MTMCVRDLKALLQQGVVRVVFLKADGSERTMLATTHPSRMPPAPDTPSTAERSGRRMAEDHLLVWDIEASGLRSFNAGRLLEDPLLIENLDHESR